MIFARHALRPFLASIASSHHFALDISELYFNSFSLWRAAASLDSLSLCSLVTSQFQSFFNTPTLPSFVPLSHPYPYPYPKGGTRDYVIVGSDSGRITILDYNAEHNRFAYIPPLLYASLTLSLQV